MGNIQVDIRTSTCAHLPEGTAVRLAFPLPPLFLSPGLPFPMRERDPLVTRRTTSSFGYYRSTTVHTNAVLSNEAYYIRANSQLRARMYQRDNNESSMETDAYRRHDRIAISLIG